MIAMLDVRIYNIHVHAIIIIKIVKITLFLLRLNTDTYIQ